MEIHSSWRAALSDAFSSVPAVGSYLQELGVFGALPFLKLVGLVNLEPS